MTAVLKQSHAVQGVDKAEIEHALMELSRQLEYIDETIKNRIDHEVWDLFQVQQKEIKNVEIAIVHLLQYKEEIHQA